MIFLNKKYILICLLFILFLISIYNFNLQPKVLETSSTPVSNHIIVLDAGHGLPDGGAVASDGTYESDINLEIVKKLQKLLESSSCTVILTRSDENGIYKLDANTIHEKKVSDMKNRIEIGNNSNADIFVSVHLNKISQSKYSGWQTFYKDNDQKGLKLANSIQENLNYSIQKENKRTPKEISNIYLSKHLEIPFCLVECGFLSNKSELSLLKTKNYQEILAWGIYTGIMDYFK